MDVPTFQATYPIYRKTDPTFIQATLNRAARAVDPAVWGAQWDDGVGLLTAYWLEVDEFGTATSLKDGKSTYGPQFEAMKIAVVGGGFGVAAGCGAGPPYGPWWNP